MGKKSRSKLKSYFQTRDFPSEQEFGDLIDSTWNFTDDGASSSETPVPIGGSAGDVLVKLSATDYDMGWTDTPGFMNTFAKLNAIVSDKNLVNLEDSQTFAGTQEFLNAKVTGQLILSDTATMRNDTPKSFSFADGIVIGPKGYTAPIPPSDSITIGWDAFIGQKLEMVNKDGVRFFINITNDIPPNAGISFGGREFSIGGCDRVLISSPLIIEGDGAFNDGVSLANPSDAVLSLRNFADSGYADFEANRVKTDYLSANALTEIEIEDDIKIGGALAGFAISMIGSIGMKETGAAVSDVSDYGQWWVKSSTPCVPYFTDDIGGDHSIYMIKDGEEDHPYMGVYFSTPVVTTGLGSGYVKASGVTTITNSSSTMDDGASPTSNRIRYTGTETRHFHVVLQATMSPASGSQILGIQLYHWDDSAGSGSLVTHSDARSNVSSTVQQQVTSHADLAMDQNDYLEVHIENHTSSADVTIDLGYMFVMGMKM